MTTPIQGLPPAGAHSGMAAARPDPLPDPLPGPQARLRAVATDLEAAFLAEMLQHAGFGAARESLGGGIGEEQMTSMLRNEHARAIAAQGGIGLAEQIFAALVRRGEAAR